MRIVKVDKDDRNFATFLIAIVAITSSRILRFFLPDLVGLSHISFGMAITLVAFVPLYLIYKYIKKKRKTPAEEDNHDGNEE